MVDTPRWSFESWIGSIEILNFTNPQIQGNQYYWWECSQKARTQLDRIRRAPKILVSRRRASVGRLLYNIAGGMIFRVITEMSETYPFLGLPSAQGLYHPQNEHDGCGVGFVADIAGRKSHDIVLKGIQILINLTHRGACGCDPETGDGAGILIQIPHSFFDRECKSLGFGLPSPGEYGVGMVFLPVDRHERILCEGILEKIATEEGLKVLGWRDTPLNGNAIGRLARASQPYIEQIFIRRGPEMDQDALERKLYVVRKRAEAAVAESDFKEKGFFYLPSLSSRTIVYKGLLLAPQITDFYKELLDEEVTSALSLVHQRFSTNTFPSWQLAHPYRYVCHNGEINTLRGNVNWMYARQSVLASRLEGRLLNRPIEVVMNARISASC